MFKCKSLGFEEDDQVSIKIPSETSQGGMATWTVKNQKTVFWRGWKDTCLSCAMSSTFEPHRIEGCLLLRLSFKGLLPISERVQAPGSLLPMPAGWAQQERAACFHFIPLIGHLPAVTSGQVCNGSAPVSYVETIYRKCSQQSPHQTVQGLVRPAWQPDFLLCQPCFLSLPFTGLMIFNRLVSQIQPPLPEDPTCKRLEVGFCISFLGLL